MKDAYLTFFFCRRLPEIEKTRHDFYSNDFVKEGDFYLFDEFEYDFYNMMRDYYSDIYKSYNLSNSVDSIVSSDYFIEIYRVLVCGKLTGNLSRYINSHTAHTYSRFRYSTDSIKVLNAKIVINR